MKNIILDKMEYSTNKEAQNEYVSSDITESVSFSFESGVDSSHSIGNNGGDQYWSAVRIVTTENISCSSISIYLLSKVGTPTGDMTFRIETDNGDKPSGVLFDPNAVGTIANASLSAPAWNKCNFDTPFHLPAGVYWAVVYIPDQAVSGTRWNWSRDNNGVGGGGYSTNHGSSWTTAIDGWMGYVRLYKQVLQCFSEPTIKTEGSYSLKGVATTDALGETLTRETEISLIDEGINPVFPAGAIGETSIIMDGNNLDCWYAGSSFVKLYYTYASDSICGSFAAPTGPLLEDIRFPYIFKEGGIYYLFAHRIGFSGLYMWQSPDKLTWTIMNSGNPVLTPPTDPDSKFKFFYNVSVAVVDGIWHMLIESGHEPDQSDVALHYSYSTLAELNWDTHRCEVETIPGGGNPHLIYLPEKKSFLVLYGKAYSSTYWVIRAAKASADDDLSDPDSWTEGNFGIDYPTLVTADPHLAVLGSSKEHNIAIQFFYNQQYIYQLYSNLSLNNFFDFIDQPVNLSDIDEVRFDIRSSRTGSNIKVGLHNSNGTTTEITPNILVADTFQRVNIDLSGVTNTNKNAIDRIIVTIVNADAENVFYIDDFYVSVTDVFDSLNISELIEKKVVLPKTDSISISESIFLTPGKSASLFESVPISENLANHSTLGLSDTEGISDLLERVSTFKINLSDSIAILDVGEINHYKSFSDSISISELATSIYVRGEKFGEKSEWKYKIKNPSTGKFIATLVDARNRWFVERLNDETEAGFTLDADDINCNATILNLGVNELYIFYGATLKWAGQLTTARKVASKNDIYWEVTAKDWVSLLRKRFTGVEELREFTTTDAGQIAKTLIQETQALTNGNFGITYGTIQTSITRSPTYDKKNILEAIKELSNLGQDGSASYGFDFEITPLKVFNVYYPYRGTIREDVVFRYPDNCENFEALVDSWSIVNQEWGLGRHWTGNTAVVSRSDATSQLTYKRREAIKNYKDMSVLSFLQDMVYQDIQWLKDPSTVIKFNARVDAKTGINDYNVGDGVTVVCDKFDINEWLWVYERKIEIEDNDELKITLTVGD